MQIASTLAMHTAAMKPSYLKTEEVPQSAKDQAINEQREITIGKLKEGTPEAQKEKAIAGAEKTAVAKLLKSEVLMEQELATSEESQTVA
jgi:translation elongation factor EF-Ts